MNLFAHARLKLTLFYVSTIMFISLLFSYAIFKVVSFEINRSFNRIEHRIVAGQFGLTITDQAPADFTLEARNTAKQTVKQRLIHANFIILIFATLGGYFLSGKTLAPIEASHQQQKQFIADASHELKTPLTALHTSIEVALRDKKLNLKTAKSALNNSLNDLSNLEDLTQNLLSLSSLQDNGLNISPVDLDDAIYSVVKNLEPLITKRKLTLKLNLEPIIINADESRLTELITILLDNAIKYNQTKGKITITTKKTRTKAIILIKDTGLGISKKDLPHIFDRFYRTDKSRSAQNVTGSGLGLSLAKKIVNCHHGSIKVSSKPNQGSTFTLSLPLKQN